MARTCARRPLPVLSWILLPVLLVGCGSKGHGNAPPVTTKMLHWESPTTYLDESKLTAVTDLDRYLVYANTDGVFRETDKPVDNVSALMPNSTSPRTSYPLADLARAGFPLVPGVTYHVAIRVVAVNGEVSGFTSRVSFTP